MNLWFWKTLQQKYGHTKYKTKQKQDTFKNADDIPAAAVLIWLLLQIIRELLDLEKFVLNKTKTISILVA